MRARFAFMLIFAAACGPTFSPFRFIEKSRVVGSTLSVTGDPTRTTPGPGEEATLTLLTADPGPRVGRTYFLIVCRPSDSNLPIVFCDDISTFVSMSSETVLPASGMAKPNPAVTFTVPDAATLGDAKELWFFGAVCNGGVVRDPLSDPPVQGQPWNPCADDGNPVPAPYGQLVTTRIKLERDPADRNHTPELDTLTFDGAPITHQALDDDAVVGCAGAMGVPTVLADEMVHDFVATATPGSIESYVREFETEARPEDVYFRLFFTAGGSNNEYDLIDATHPQATLRWRTPPSADVDPTGTLVRFYGQIADERNAMFPFERAICVVRP